MKVICSLLMLLIMSVEANATIVTVDQKLLDFIDKSLSSPDYSCVYTSSFVGGAYHDSYLCSKTENLKKSLPPTSEYDYFIFGIIWNYQQGNNVASAGTNKRLFEFGFASYSGGKKIGGESYKLDSNALLMIDIIDKNACYSVGYRGVSPRTCTKK